MNVSTTRRGFFGLLAAVGLAPKMVLEHPAPEPVPYGPVADRPHALSFLDMTDWVDAMEPYEMPFTTMIRGDFVFDQYKYEWGGLAERFKAGGC